MVIIFDDDSEHRNKLHKLIEEFSSPSQKIEFRNTIELSKVEGEGHIILLPFSCKNNNDLTKLIDDLSKANLIVAPCGNDGIGTPVAYPASLNSVLSVGSHDQRNMVSNFSNVDYHSESYPDIYALGKHLINGELLSGTSFAALYATLLLDKQNIFSKLSNESPARYVKKNHAEEGVAWKKENHDMRSFTARKVTTKKPEPVKPKPLNSRFMSITKTKTLFTEVRLYYEGDEQINESVSDLCKKAIATLPDKTYVPLSGGIDSEIVGQLFLDIEKPFIPVIMKYKIRGEVMNQHDIQHAIDFCEENNLEPKYLLLDIPWFFEQNMHLKYAIRYYCQSPQIACHLWMLEQLNSTYVMAGDLPAVIDGKLASPPLTYYSYYYLPITQQTNSIPRLFWCSSQIIKKLLETIQKCPIHSDYETKLRIYRKLGFKTPDRNRTKQTGFEKIKEWYDNEYGGVRTFDGFFRKPMDARVYGGLLFRYDPIYLSGS